MESRVFIRQAQDLTSRIRQAKATDTLASDKDALQKEVTTLFAGLQNPSLLAAWDLRDAAQSAGLTIKPETLYKLTQGETMHPQV